MAKELAIRDKKIRQLEEHANSLSELLAKNSASIDDKIRANKYLLTAKHKFREYDEAINNIKHQQIESLQFLKKYLLSLKTNPELEEYEIENINFDLADVENELAKINK